MSAAIMDAMPGRHRAQYPAQLTLGMIANAENGSAPRLSWRARVLPQIAWPANGPRLFCRVHGEPLLLDWQWMGYRCPVQHVCGTWVSLELLERKSR